MRIAAIDIGTNSVHMIVVRVRPDLSFEVIDREKAMVRLGAGCLDGRAFRTRGMKTFQFVRTPAGWRISAVAWDDEREGLSTRAAGVQELR